MAGARQAGLLAHIAGGRSAGMHSIATAVIAADDQADVLANWRCGCIAHAKAFRHARRQHRAVGVGC